MAPDLKPEPDPQLSPEERVESDVASLALDRGAVLPAAPAPLEGLSDADIMLRVKAGDDSAFDYLVAKYRRPIVSFMHRTTRNPGVAEELAQEGFLRGC